MQPACGARRTFSRNFHQILTLASQPDLPARRLVVGETYTPFGQLEHVSAPHRHEKDDLPREAFHEELYYFKSESGGWVWDDAVL